MKGNGMILLVVVVIAFLFFRNSQKVTTTSQTVGLTPATSGTVSQIISGLFSIFNGNTSPLSGVPANESILG